MLADARLKGQASLVRTRAEQAAMELAEAKGELVRADEVTRLLFQLGREVRDALLVLPARVAPVVAGMDAGAATIELDREIRQVLEQLSGGLAGMAPLPMARVPIGVRFPPDWAERWYPGMRVSCNEAHTFIGGIGDDRENYSLPWPSPPPPSGTLFRCFDWARDGVGEWRSNRHEERVARQTAWDGFRPPKQ